MTDTRRRPETCQDRRAAPAGRWTEGAAGGRASGHRRRRGKPGTCCGPCTRSPEPDRPRGAAVISLRDMLGWDLRLHRGSFLLGLAAGAAAGGRRGGHGACAPAAEKWRRGRSDM